MIDICGNEIRFTQGNSAVIGITPIDTSTGKPIELEGTDKVLFTVKRRYGETVIQKVLTSSDADEDGVLLCSLKPDDTLNLSPGEYEYDCLYVAAGDQAVTFISSAFYLVRAIGKYTDVNGGDSDAD